MQVPLSSPSYGRYNSPSPMSHCMNHICSDRLLIRPMRGEDSPSIFSYRSNPEVVRYQMWRPASEQEVRRFIREQRGLVPGLPGVWFQFSIVELRNDRLIGDCGILASVDQPDAVELGLTLRPEAQGRGFATEALFALLRYCFDSLHVHRIVARTHRDNTRSLNLLSRCRFPSIPTEEKDKELTFILRQSDFEATD
jgi:RimJ/RimL family protein N-acetyltransferase